MEKVYIVLYICGSSRVVYFDVVLDLSVEMFIISFKCFICRWGILRLVVLDNVKIFKIVVRFLLFIFELLEV